MPKHLQRGGTVGIVMDLRLPEDEVKANADYMDDNLNEYGWQYIVIDIRWYVDIDKSHGYNEKDSAYVMDEYGRCMPSLVGFLLAANGKEFLRHYGDWINPVVIITNNSKIKLTNLEETKAMV